MKNIIKLSRHYWKYKPFFFVTDSNGEYSYSGRNWIELVRDYFRFIYHFA